MLGQDMSYAVVEYLKKINLKLEKDDKLKLFKLQHYIDIDDTLSVPLYRKGSRDYKFENKDYTFFFLKSNSTIHKPKFNTPILLYIETVVTSNNSSDDYDDSLIVLNENTTSIQRVLKFDDLYYLRRNYPKKYAKLQSYLLKDPMYENAIMVNANNIKYPKLLGKAGYSVSNNKNYLYFNNSNSMHYYPNARLIYNTNFDQNFDTLKSSLESVSEHWNVDASFSHITFRHLWMRKFFGYSNDNTGLSIELNVQDNLLNLLPWQGMSISLGARSLFILDTLHPVYENNFINAKVAYIFRFANYSFVDKLPFFFGSKPKLNLGSRAMFNFYITHPFTLPDLNFYLAIGKKEFTEPFIVLNKENNLYSYFSITQAFATMSFYWNTRSDDFNRFRIDLGAGYYDMFKIFYKADFNVKKIIKLDGKIIPLLILYYNFVPRGNDLLGVKLKVFDAVGMLSVWVKLLDFDSSTLRFETIYLSKPMGRKMREWEANSSVFFQFRFRYGM